MAHDHHHPPRAASTNHLAIPFAATAMFCVVEFIGGWLTNSLALLSDAGHMLADVGALGVGLFAARLAQRPPSEFKTFGYHRGEILAAFVNGLLLWLVVGLIWSEAYQRLFTPQVVNASGMLGIAAAGLGVNLISLTVLGRSKSESLNVRAAFVHVLGDTLGSVGALIAGVVMLTTGSYIADPLVSVVIGALILYSSWGVIRESVDILMQGVPRDINLPDVERCLLDIGGVRQVHDLHIWTMTSGKHQLSVHLVVDSSEEAGGVLDSAQSRLRDRFGISHTTVQVDPGDECSEEFRLH